MQTSPPGYPRRFPGYEPHPVLQGRKIRWSQRRLLPPAGLHPIPPSPRKGLNRLHLLHARASPFLSGGSAGNPGTAEPVFQDSPALLKGFPLEISKLLPEMGVTELWEDPEKQNHSQEGDSFGCRMNAKLKDNFQGDTARRLKLQLQCIVCESETGAQF